MPVQKKSGNLLKAPCIYIYIYIDTHMCVCVCVYCIVFISFIFWLHYIFKTIITHFLHINLVNKSSTDKVYIYKKKISVLLLSALLLRTLHFHVYSNNRILKHISSEVKRTRHAEHCWRSRDELIRDVLLWTPTHGRAKAGRPARTYIQQLCEDTGCCPEDLPRAMNDREEWREKVRDIRATSATWWWWWWFHLKIVFFSPNTWHFY